MEWVKSFDHTNQSTSDVQNTYVKGMRERPMAQLDLDDFHLLSFVTRSIGGNIFGNVNKTEGKFAFSLKKLLCCSIFAPCSINT